MPLHFTVEQVEQLRLCEDLAEMHRIVRDLTAIVAGLDAPMTEVRRLLNQLHHTLSD